MEEDKVNLFSKVGTLGGKVKLNQSLKGMYLGGSGNMSKEKLFGITGPLHPGMHYHKGEIAIEATQSDTKADLIRELCEQSGFTKREAETVVNEMIASGHLVEVNLPDLGKVLVFKK